MSEDVASFVRDAMTIEASMRTYRQAAERIERQVTELESWQVLTRHVFLNCARIARHAAQAEFLNPRSEDDQMVRDDWA